MKIDFKNNVTVKDSMIFESIFEEELQLSLEEKTELLENCEKTWMFVDGEIAGEIYTISVQKLIGEGVEEPDDQKIVDDITPYVDYGVYYHSTSILPRFRGLGLSKIFKCFHNGYLKGLGYKVIVGHSTSDEIEKVNESLGAKHIRTHENWYETDRAAKFYELYI